MRGLTRDGKVTAVLLLAVFISVAALGALALSGAMKTADSPKPPARSGPAAVKPAPEPPPKPAPKVLVHAAQETAAIALTVITYGLDATVDSVLETSDRLVEDLGAAFGMSKISSLLARAEVLADGPPAPGVPPAGPGRDGARGVDAVRSYVPVYRGYLSRVESTKAAVGALSVRGADRLLQRALTTICDALARDITVIIEAIERLESPAARETETIVGGIESAVERMKESSRQLDALLQRR